MGSWHPYIVLFGGQLYVCMYTYIYIGFPESSVGKESTSNAGDPGLILGPERTTIYGLPYTYNVYIYIYQGFPGDSVVKNLPANAGDVGSTPGLERSPGGGNGDLLWYPCLGNPMDRGVWWATVHGVTKSWTQMSD